MAKKASVESMAKNAKEAALVLASLPASAKNAALRAMAAAVRSESKRILAANAKDTAAAKKLLAAGKLSAPLYKRLLVDKNKIEEMARGIESVAKLPDPAGILLEAIELDRGLILEKITCPIGVIGAVFESRPDAVPQIASLCLKSGNAVILKGGAEAKNSNAALTEILANAAVSVKGVPLAAIQFIETREDVARVLALDEYVDLLIPRGSNAFVKFIQDNTRIPVLGHADGICHVYVDRAADIQMAVDIVYDSKTQYPAACNAAETLLVHRDIAEKFLPDMAAKFKAGGVEMRGGPASRRMVGGIIPAVKEDWDTEYLDLIISIRVVDSIDDAIQHINYHGSHHTDAIVTRDNKAAKRFLADVDSACVFHNCSTRFSDGFRFGKGAEVGISTNKTHARGPVGLDGLVIYKYVVRGSGQRIEPYTGPNAKKFTHRRIKASK